MSVETVPCPSVAAVAPAAASARAEGATVALLDARAPGSWLRVGGGPLVLRHVRVLARQGVTRIGLVAGADAPALRAPRGVTLERVADPAPWAATASGPVLLVRASYLIDPRALEALRAAAPGHRLPASLDADAGLSAALVPPSRLAALWADAADAVPLPCLDLAAIDTHHQEQRTRVPLHLRAIDTAAAARGATWDLILATQKQVQDLPSEYIDPPFENAITYALCATAVTPNQVTYACFLIAVGIGLLFLRGDLLLGAALTYLVEWLDGVDGKLARVKLQFSKIGEFESAFDYFYENFWWFAITWAVAGLGHGFAAWQAGALLLASDLVCNILIAIWVLRGARCSLDEIAPIDARFRRIGGRRNIYCALFLAGFALGVPLATLCVVAAWAVTTATWYTVRLCLNWRRAPGLRPGV